MHVNVFFVLQFAELKNKIIACLKNYLLKFTNFLHFFVFYMFSGHGSTSRKEWFSTESFEK